MQSLSRLNRILAMSSQVSAKQMTEAAVCSHGVPRHCMSPHRRLRSEEWKMFRSVGLHSVHSREEREAIQWLRTTKAVSKQDYRRLHDNMSGVSFLYSIQTLRFLINSRI
jgi:hypothetical protein